MAPAEKSFSYLPVPSYRNVYFRHRFSTIANVVDLIIVPAQLHVVPVIAHGQLLPGLPYAKNLLEKRLLGDAKLRQ